MAHILLITHGSYGDLYPFLRTGIKLKERGHRVTLLSHCIFSETVCEAGLEFRALDTPEEYRQMISQLPSQVSFDPKAPEAVFAVIETGADYYIREFHIIESAAEEPGSVLVFRSRTAIAAYLASEKLKIPCVAVALAPSFVDELFIESEFAGKKWMQTINRAREILDLPRVKSLVSFSASPSSLQGWWPRWFGSDSYYEFSTPEPVGFPLNFDYEGDEIPGEFLEQVACEQTLLITGGTSKVLDSQFYSLVLGACRELNLSVAVVTKNRELIEGIDKWPGLRWYEQLPYDRVLPMTRGIVHHGGIGTCCAAMAAEVPQLILPRNFDRPDNALRIKKAGVGDYLSVREWQPAHMLKKMREFLEFEFSDSCKKLLGELKEKNDYREICEGIEKAIGNRECIICSSAIENYDRPEKKKAGDKPQLTPEQKKRIAAVLKAKKRSEDG